MGEWLLVTLGVRGVYGWGVNVCVRGFIRV